MLIFGWRGRTKTLFAGTFDCPVCKSRQPYAVAATRPWFTLFFIPIFPVGVGITNTICGGCGSILNPNASTVHTTPGSSLHGALEPTKQAQPHTSSSLSIISLVLGILSPFFIVTCLLSIFTSLAAIVTGHVALYNIKTQAGRLHGRGMAWAGLILGYLSLALSFAVIVFLLTWKTDDNGMFAASKQEGSTANVRLRDAELMVTAQSGLEVGMGNTDEARQIAIEFAELMKNLNDELFESGRKRVLQLSRGEFLTYCELHPGSCALIVHVPSYRDYDEDAKAALADIAWTAAITKVSGSLHPNDDLAVALRGTFLYGDIMLGSFPTDRLQASARVAGDSDDLLPFFSVTESIPNSFKTDSLQNETSSVTRVHPPDSVPSQDASIPNADFPPTDFPPTPIPPTPPTDLPPSVRPDSNNLPPRSTRPKKPEEPPFENRIPTALVLELDDRGWGIQSMTFLNNDAWLAVGRLDMTIDVFDTKSGARLFQSDRIDELGQVIALERSRDSKYLVAGGSKGVSLVFEVNSQGQLANPKPLYQQSRDAGTIVASPRFDFVLTGGHDGTLAWQPYDQRSDNLKLLQKLKKQVQAAFLPIDGMQAVATDGQQLVHFDLQSGELITEKSLSNRYSHAAAFHPQGTHLAVSYGSEVQEFHADSGVLQRTYKAKKSGIQWSVAFHPTKPWLFTGDRGKVLVWDRDTGEQLAELDLRTTQYVQTLALSVDAKYIAAVPASAGQSAKIFKIVE